MPSARDGHAFTVLPGSSRSLPLQLSQTIWDSTGKAIFRDYSKYEAGFLQYGWKGRNWVEYTLRKTKRKTRLVPACGVKKREEVPGHCQHARQGHRGHSLTGAAQGGMAGSWRAAHQHCPTLHTDQQRSGEEAWKGERTDSACEGRGQRAV